VKACKLQGIGNVAPVAHGASDKTSWADALFFNRGAFDRPGKIGVIIGDGLQARRNIERSFQQCFSGTLGVGIPGKSTWFTSGTENKFN
jgi:hypothetical protein